MARRLAAADIGSNTAHMLVAEVEGGKVRRVVNESEWLSLGQVVAKKGEIPKELEKRIAGILAGFKKTAAEFGAEALYVFATEAVRKARGHDDSVERIEKAAGVAIEVVGPELEAEMAMRGAMIDMPSTKPFHFVEVGGGSAQVAYWESGRIVQEESLPIGTGVLMARHNLSQPVKKDAAAGLAEDVQSHLDALDSLKECPRFVASGGVARGIWRALHPDGDPNVAVRELEYIEWACGRLSTKQIVQRFRVKEQRAETLYTGSVLYRLLMERLQHKTMRVSTFGVREGAVLMMHEGAIVGADL
jgi:exopolyphosphatase/guanosine-5'-triphosphate,3'-diphosphate pyrophosphatase